jgi:hypothetical protein
VSPWPNFVVRTPARPSERLIGAQNHAAPGQRCPLPRPSPRRGFAPPRAMGVHALDGRGPASV